jgi:hypothetical protein
VTHFSLAPSDDRVRTADAAAASYLGGAAKIDVHVLGGEAADRPGTRVRACARQRVWSHERGRKAPDAREVRCRSRRGDEFMREIELPNSSAGRADGTADLADMWKQMGARAGSQSVAHLVR